MSEAQTFTSEQQQSLEQFVALVQGDQAELAASVADYIDAAVTGTFTVGPEGANLNGWITYKNSGLKISFQLESLSSFWGVGAGVLLAPSIGVLRPEQLGGQIGTFEVQAALHTGVLYARVGGAAVFDRAFRIGGVGSPFGWGAKGSVRFNRPVP